LSSIFLVKWFRKSSKIQNHVVVYIFVYVYILSISIKPYYTSSLVGCEQNILLHAERSFAARNVVLIMKNRTFRPVEERTKASHGLSKYCTNWFRFFEKE